MVLHPRICERIAANVALVRRLGGAKDASKWWSERFGHMDKSDYDQVLAELRRRSGNPNTPQP